MEKPSEERWNNAVAYARQALDIYKTVPMGGFATGWIAADIKRYEQGERSEELLVELEGIEL